MQFQELLYKLLYKSNTKLLSNNYCSIRLYFAAKGNPKKILLYFVSLADDLVNNAIYYLVIFLSRMLTLDENTLRTLRKCPKLYISLLNCFRTNSLFRIFYSQEFQLITWASFLQIMSGKFVLWVINVKQDICIVDYISIYLFFNCITW